MKAPSSDTRDDDGAEGEKEIDFDYRDFFSVLMYYGHMSKEEILNSSRPFLHGIYRMYAKRACENLGVSSDPAEEEGLDGLTKNDYPSDFGKLNPSGKVESSPAFSSTEDFLSLFPDTDKYKNAIIAKNSD